MGKRIFPSCGCPFCDVISLACWAIASPVRSGPGDGRSDVCSEQPKEGQAERVRASSRSCAERYRGAGFDGSSLVSTSVVLPVRAWFCVRWLTAPLERAQRVPRDAVGRVPLATSKGGSPQISRHVLQLFCCVFVNSPSVGKDSPSTARARSVQH